jgi:prepilin peptidase CpaA
LEVFEFGAPIAMYGNGIAIMRFPGVGGKEYGEMHSIAWWPTLFVLLVATFTDLRSRRIPNWLVIPFLLAGILISPFRPDWQGNGRGFGWHGFGQGFADLGQSLAGMGLGILIFGVLFWLGGMGGGDLKLCAALGAWIGPMQLFIAMVYTGMAGGIMVLCWAGFGGFFKELFTGASDLVFGLKERGTMRDPELTLANPLKRRMPYAPAIAIGTLLSFFAR